MKVDSSLYKDWLKKAENDLLAANGIMFYYEEPPTDTICYHCHQVAEKGLKAFLLYSKVEIPRIHDLVELLNLSIFKQKSLASFKEDIQTLNKYYIEAKYPLGKAIFYPKKEAIEAINVADKFLKKINKVIN